MAKKEKKKGRQTGKSEGDNLLRKLGRSELLELLLEQTRRADALEKQLERAEKEREESDSRLKDVLTLSKFAIDMIDKEAGQRALDIIEKEIAEGKLVRTKDIKAKLAENEDRKPQAAVKPQNRAPVKQEPVVQTVKPALAKPKPVVQTVKPAPAKSESSTTSGFIDSNGFIDVAKIFENK